MRRLLTIRTITVAASLVVLVAVVVLAATGGTYVPEWLARKLEFEAKHDEIARDQRQRSVKEIEELKRKWDEAPKDEKGNPILSEESIVEKPPMMPPQEDLGVIETSTTVYLPSPVRERFIFTSQASAPYDVLIAGRDQQDENTGVIFRVNLSSPDGFQISEHDFPGNGPIVLDSLEENDKVVTFRWGNEKGKGYFDLRTGEVVFKEYSP